MKVHHESQTAIKFKLSLRKSLIFNGQVFEMI
jgi:hypothetical protein